MTVPPAELARVTTYLESLLPVHVRQRDHEAGGLLRTLLEAVAGELARLEADTSQLYDAWFIETCPEWVVPYLADLVGLDGLPPDLGSGSRTAVSRRTVVANTVAYRRRKGTVAVVEQVVRDVTGWPSRAVEYYRLLSTTTHHNHVRLDRPATASLRGAASLEHESPRLARGALTRLPHLGETRRIASGRGRYGIAHLGVFAFPVQVYDVPSAPARAGAGRWSTHPLGWDEPLFAPPATETQIEHLADEADLPVPLRPRRLLALLHAARDSGDGDALPIQLRVDGGPPLDAERIRVCGLEDLAQAAGAPLPGWQVMVDAVSGQLHPYENGVVAEPSAMHVTYSYGALADVGAGTQNRAATHQDALDADPFRGDVDTGGDEVRAQVHVLTDPVAPGAVASVAAGLAAVTAGWADPALGLLGGTQVLSVGDSEAYSGDLSVHVPAESRLVVVAAHWRGRRLSNGDIEAPVPGVYAPEGLRPVVRGTLTVTGGPGSSVVLDGLIVDGDVVVGSGSLGSLTLSQCTVAGRVEVRADATGANRAAVVTVLHSMVGSVAAADTVPWLSVRNCVFDPALQPAAAPQTLLANGAAVSIDGSTLRGPVRVRTLDVTSSICDGVVLVADRQVGCARFSYLGAGSRVPRRFHCVPGTDAATAIGPSFTADEPGSPFYLDLGTNTPPALARGGEFGAEMGVHHHLHRPVRLDAARRIVAPYLPAGLEIGMVGN